MYCGYIICSPTCGSRSTQGRGSATDAHGFSTFVKGMVLKTIAPDFDGIVKYQQRVSHVKTFIMYKLVFDQNYRITTHLLQYHLLRSFGVVNFIEPSL